MAASSTASDGPIPSSRPRSLWCRPPPDTNFDDSAARDAEVEALTQRMGDYYFSRSAAAEIPREIVTSVALPVAGADSREELTGFFSAHRRALAEVERAAEAAASGGGKEEGRHDDGQAMEASYGVDFATFLGEDGDQEDTAAVQGEGALVHGTDALGDADVSVDRDFDVCILGPTGFPTEECDWLLEGVDGDAATEEEELETRESEPTVGVGGVADALASNPPAPSPPGVERAGERAHLVNLVLRNARAEAARLGSRDDWAADALAELSEALGLRVGNSE